MKWHNTHWNRPYLMYSIVHYYCSTFPQNLPRYFARTVDKTLAIYTSKRAARPGRICYYFSCRNALPWRRNLQKNNPKTPHWRSMGENRKDDLTLEPHYSGILTRRNVSETLNSSHGFRLYRGSNRIRMRFTFFPPSQFEYWLFWPKRHHLECVQSVIRAASHWNLFQNFTERIALTAKRFNLHTCYFVLL